MCWEVSNHDCVQVFHRKNYRRSFHSYLEVLRLKAPSKFMLPQDVCVKVWLLLHIFLLVYSLVMKSCSMLKDVKRRKMENWKMSVSGKTSRLSKLSECLRLKRGWRLFEEFSKDTSIHGVKFVGSKKKHWTERCKLKAYKFFGLVNSRINFSEHFGF